MRQKDLAEELGLAQTTIANYEQGIRFPNQDTLILFADYFNVSLDYLLGRNSKLDNKFSIETSIDKNILKNSELLSKEYLKLLIDGKKDKATQLIHTAVKSGLEVKDIYLNVFQRTLKEIGDLWELNKIDVFQEHYISSATEAIMSQLHSLISCNKDRNYSIIGVCVNGDYHCIGLRMVIDFFEMEGWNTYFLGTNVPTQDIIKAIYKFKADVLAISATMPFNINGVENLIKAVKNAENLNNVKILVGGNAFNKDKKLWKRIGADFYAHDAEEAIEVLNKQLISSI